MNCEAYYRSLRQNATKLSNIRTAKETENQANSVRQCATHQGTFKSCNNLSVELGRAPQRTRTWQTAASPRSASSCRSLCQITATTQGACSQVDPASASMLADQSPANRIERICVAGGAREPPRAPTLQRRHVAFYLWCSP